MCWETLTTLYVIIVHNATSTPILPLGGWKPLLGDENYVEPATE